jgi:hypothetical protein
MIPTRTTNDHTVRYSGFPPDRRLDSEHTVVSLSNSYPRVFPTRPTRSPHSKWEMSSQLKEIEKRRFNFLFFVKSSVGQYSRFAATVLPQQTLDGRNESNEAFTIITVNAENRHRCVANPMVVN